MKRFLFASHLAYHFRCLEEDATNPELSQLERLVLVRDRARWIQEVRAELAGRAANRRERLGRIIVTRRFGMDQVNQTDRQAEPHLNQPCPPETQSASTEPEFERDYDLFANALLALPSTVLAASLALAEETTLFELVKAKTSDFVSGSKDAFAQHLDERARALSGLPRGELVLRILGVLNETLEVSPRHYAGRRDFEDNGQDIVAKALQILRGAEEGFTGNSLNSLIQYHMQKLFDEMGKTFETLPEAEKGKFLAQVREFIQSLPSEQRERLEKELGGGELTNELLTQAITSGALSAGIAGVVGVAGFGFYTFAVTLVHGLAGLVGLTLPFGFYTGLTSAIHVLANPIFLIALLGGGGVFLYQRKNQALRQKLAPLVVTQITLAGTATPDGLCEDAGPEALTLWADAREAVARSREAEVKANAALDDIEKEMEATSKESDRTAGQRKTNVSEAEALREELASLVATHVSEIASGAWGLNLGITSGILMDRQRKASEVATRAVRPGLFAGLWDSAKQGWKLEGAKQDAHEAARILAGLVESNWKSGLGTLPPEPVAILTKLDGLDGIIAALDKALSDLEITYHRQDAGRDQCKKAVSAAVDQRLEAEGRYWGLGELQ